MKQDRRKRKRIKANKEFKLWIDSIPAALEIAPWKYEQYLAVVQRFVDDVIDDTQATRDLREAFYDKADMLGIKQ